MGGRPRRVRRRGRGSRKKRLTGRQEDLHDLAFAFGIPPGELAKRLTEREFTRLHRDARRRFLGQRRLEILLAQLTLQVAASFGGAKDATLADFLKVLEPIEADDDFDDREPPDVQDQQAAFGFNPINRKKDIEHGE